MPSAELITIGTELLLGEITDTNSQFLAHSLRDNGIDLYRITTVGDNTQRIANAIREALNRVDIIITTGGLGPTIDDPTRDAVALALGVTTEFRAELWDQIQARFERYARKPTENNKRQAYVPLGAIAFENPVGTAPAFAVEIDQKSIISVPGVPQEMEYLINFTVIPYLRKRYQIQSVITSRILHTAGIGESLIDSQIGDLETLANPTVGLAAHSGQVDIRITSKADSLEVATNQILGLEAEIRKRLGKWIYGVDHETLEDAAIAVLENFGWKLITIEAGMQGELTRRLAPYKNTYLGGEILTQHPKPDDFKLMVSTFREQYEAEVCLGAAIYPDNEKQDVLIILITPDETQQITRPFGGPPEYAVRWAINQSLNIIRIYREKQ